MNKIFSLKHKWLLLSVLAVLLVTLLPLVGNTHIITEEPWHPAPAAYLRALFYANQKPVDWDLIAKEYDIVRESGYRFDSIYQALAPAQKVAGVDHAIAIRKAIDSKDRQALYTASTRALSQLTRHYIAEAEESLKRPGAAIEDVLNAQRTYRAFGSFIQQADPEAFKRIGLAWLDMASSVGSAGVAGIGAKSADIVKFSAGRTVIEDYLIANYEVDRFRSRRSLQPIPNSVAEADITTSLPPGSNMNDQVPLPRLVLNFEARGLDEKDLFLVAYGDMLFDSPEIFGGASKEIGLACATCHNRSDINQDFFIPGVSHQSGAADVTGEFFNPRFNNNSGDSLDIPSLRGLRFTAPYGRNGRFASLRDFTRNGIVNEFAGNEPTPLMLDALIIYMLEFDFLPAPYLNPGGTLNDRAPRAAKRGEVIFNTPFAGMDGMSCSTCHIPNSHFLDQRQHDIGSGNPASPYARDSAFDTPTLLNIKHNAPYFHDGSLNTLAQVVEWFDQRFNLSLTRAQKSDLTAYLDAVGTGEDPFEVFDDENTPFLLAWGELSTFISTLNTLIPAKDQFHADLLIRTVSPDLRADASGLQDLSQAPMVYELADSLDEIQTAINAKDWTKAERLWEEYKVVEDKYGPQFK